MKLKCLLGVLIILAGAAAAVDAGFIGALDDYVTGVTAAEGGGTVALPVDPAGNDGYIEKLTDGTSIINILNVCNIEPASATLWDNKGVKQNSNIDWKLTSGVTYSDVASAHAGIRGAYFFDGLSGYTYIGYDDGHDSYSEILTGSNAIDTSSATFEMWVRLHQDDLTKFVTLFECGGGTGTGIAVENGVLKAANDITEAMVTYNLLTDLMGLLTSHCTNDFFQIVFAMDYVNNLNSLYVNGILVDTATNNNGDWDGGDGTSIGHFTGTNHGGFKNGAAGTMYDTYFHGAVSIYKIHDGALTADQAKQNYTAIHDNTDVNGDPIAVAGIYTNATDVATAVDSDIILPSGATIQRSSVDNSLSYNPDTIPGFYDIWAGYDLTETFEYQVVDGGFSTNKAEVTFTVQTESQAVPDVFTVVEGDVRVFLPGELAGNDQQIGMGAWMELNAASVTEQDVADGKWRNVGTVGSDWDFTVTAGELVDVASGFGGIGRAWRDIDAKGLALEDNGENISAADLTVEVWFKPDYSQKGDMVLYETGGSTYGTYIVYESDSNMVRVSLDADFTGDNYGNRMDVRIGGVSFDEFNQLIVVYDRDNPNPADSLTLYLNNDPTAAFNATPAGADTNTVGSCNDFSGGDDAGIGNEEGDSAHQFDPDSLYDGDISMVCVYDRKLSVADMIQRYEDVKRGIMAVYPSSPATTALGATVTIGANSVVTYDSTTITTNLLEGESADDTFTYTVSDGAGGTTTTNVLITVQGLAAVRTVADTITVTAGQAITNFNPLANDIGFSGSATVGVGSCLYSYLADYATSTVSGAPADFRDPNGYGARYMWNAPTNWVDGSPALVDAYSGYMGETNCYRLLVWEPTRNAWLVNNSGNRTDGFPGGYTEMDADGPHAGLGVDECRDGVNTNYVARGVVFSYTVGADGYYQITNAWIKKNSATGDAIVLSVYVDETRYLILTNAPLAVDEFNVDLGYVTKDQSVYICVDSYLSESWDECLWDFDLLYKSTLGFSGETWDNVVLTGDGSTLSFATGDSYLTLGVGQSVYETFNYTVTDGGTTWVETVTVEIQGVNEAPEGVDDTINANEDDIVSGSLVANDLDVDIGDQPTLGIYFIEGGSQTLGVPFTTPLGALFSVNADGSYVYNPNGQFEGMLPGEFVYENFTYLVQDQHGVTGAVASAISIVVEGRDDGVTATENEYIVKADGTVSGNLIADDTGSGVDSSVDHNDILSILSVNTNGLKGKLSSAAAILVAKRGKLTNLTGDKQTITYGPAGIISDPVVFATPMTWNGQEPAAVRITNIDSVNSTFDIQVTEQPEDGLKSDGDGNEHADEEVTWFVFEAGSYQLLDGTMFEVGKVSTDAVRQKSGKPDGWETVSFTTAFNNQPIVINQLQSYDYTNELFSTRMDGQPYSSGGVNTTGFRVAMEDYEYDQDNRYDAYRPETIGWIAMEKKAGVWSGNNFEAWLTQDDLHIADMTVNFQNTYSSVPGLIGCVATYHGADPMNMRLVSIGTSNFKIRGVEDSTSDDETGHTNEEATYLAIEGTGDLYAYLPGLAQGGFTFDTNGDFTPYLGKEDLTFTYTLTDLYGNTDTKTVTLHVIAPFNGSLLILR